MFRTPRAEREDVAFHRVPSESGLQQVGPRRAVDRRHAGERATRTKRQLDRHGNVVRAPDLEPECKGPVLFRNRDDGGPSLYPLCGRLSRGM